MLNNILQNFWDTGKFTSSWIISTDNLERSLESLKLFAKNILGVGNLPIENNPDFRVIERGLNSAKNEAKYISVDQVRELQNFMNSTSAVSNCKIAVIFEADLMNLNAYNCCLKILEEAPRDSYIFLLTTRPGNIIATIKSRCMKISDITPYHSTENEAYIEDLLQNNIDKKIKMLGEITSKDSKELWDKFCSDILIYLYKKRDVTKYDKVQKLIQDTKDFDLDKKHIGILILENI